MKGYRALHLPNRCRKKVGRCPVTCGRVLRRLRCPDADAHSHPRRPLVAVSRPGDCYGGGHCAPSARGSLDTTPVPETALWTHSLRSRQCAPAGPRSTAAGVARRPGGGVRAPKRPFSFLRHTEAASKRFCADVPHHPAPVLPTSTLWRKEDWSWRRASMRALHGRRSFLTVGHLLSARY